MEASPVGHVIDGLYTLNEWHRGDIILRPPQVEGRYILSNNNCVLMVSDHSVGNARTTWCNIGIFDVQKDSFSYGWTQCSKFTESPDNVIASHALTFEGTRRFSVVHDGDSIRFKSLTPKLEEFHFLNKTLHYSEEGKILRVWSRA
jgi:hypothetical protein